ncbi:MAG: CSLREA domain-containing protein [Acidimicrobiia bacterium]
MAASTVALGGGSTVEAASYVVNTLGDVDDTACDATHCSLREAILAANASPESDTITFESGCPERSR